MKFVIGYIFIYIKNRQNMVKITEHDISYISYTLYILAFLQNYFRVFIFVYK